MPQIYIEFTQNLLIDEIKNDFVLKIHNVVNTVVGINIDNCKSRFLKIQDFYIGKGESNHAFMHIVIRFLDGRNPRIKRQLGKEVLELAQDRLKELGKGLKVQITVLIEDLPKKYYFKHPPGTFTTL